MNMRTVSVLCVSAMLSLVAGCSDFNTQNPVTIVLGMQDDGTAVNAATSDRFVIVLPDNGGSAYGWVVAGGDPAVVSLEQTKEVTVSTPGIAGQTAMETVVLLAAGKGTTTLRLEYRLLDAPTAAIDTFSVTITNEI